MKKAIPGRTLLSATQLRKRVKELGKEITAYYKDKPLTVVGLMNGSLFFLVDLMRELPIDTQIECWKISSYKGDKSSGKVEGLQSCTGDFHGREVLIMDDILDTGLTLHEVCLRLQELGARRIKICVLLKKRKKREVSVKADWYGFEIGSEFVIGYGLDLDQRYRSLPMIRVLES